MQGEPEPPSAAPGEPPPQGANADPNANPGSDPAAKPDPGTPGSAPAAKPPPQAPRPGSAAAAAAPPTAAAKAAARSHRYSSGKWRPSLSLQGPKGLPVRMEYDMQGGKGKVRLKRHDGSVCSGDAVTSMQNGKLVYNTTSNIRCADGTNFGRPRVECPAGSRGGKGCVMRSPGSKRGIPVGSMKPGSQ